MSRRRGVTLIELVIYMSLVTVGLLMIGGVEMAAQRSAAMQQDLLDIQFQALSFSRALRADIEAARWLRYRVLDDTLTIQRADGRWVFYTPGRRAERQEQEGPDLHLELFGLVKRWAVDTTPVTGRDGRVTTRYLIELELEVMRERQPLVRRRRISAAPRMEVQGE